MLDMVVVKKTKKKMMMSMVMIYGDDDGVENDHYEYGGDQDDSEEDEYDEYDHEYEEKHDIYLYISTGPKFPSTSSCGIMPLITH
jgi:hypothetical protein